MRSLLSVENGELHDLLSVFGLWMAEVGDTVSETRCTGDIAAAETFSDTCCIVLQNCMTLLLQ